MLPNMMMIGCEDAEGGEAAKGQNGGSRVDRMAEENGFSEMWMVQTQIECCEASWRVLNRGWRSY